MRRITIAVAALLLGVAVGLPVAPPARAAGATFGPPTATFAYGQSITFVQPVTLSSSLRRAEVLLTFEGSGEPLAEEVSLGSSSQPSTLRFSWSITTAGPIAPNTTITASWRVTFTDASLGTVTGPAVTLRYEDTRFAWQTISGPIVRLHWYSGSQSFAQQALQIGEKGVQNAASLLGVTETQPIDFFVYADLPTLCGALGYDPSCNVAGEAHPEIRTLFGAISPSDISSAEINRVIPHELTHLVFQTAVKNPYRQPPDWLNEGLAVYLSEGTPDYLKSALEDAEKQGTLLPLSAYVIGFPPQALYDQFLLAYGESVSAVDFLIRTYGKSAFVKLIRSYAAGVTDDEAFKAALGVDVAGFQAAWLRDLGAPGPQQYGPQPAPPGSVPSGWGTASGAPAPVASAVATSGPLAVQTTGPTGTGAGTAGRSDSTDASVVLGLLVVVGVIIGAAIALWTRRRATPGPPAP